MEKFSLGLNKLIDSSENLKGFYIGKVVDDGAEDSMGRIKVRIESLFGDEKQGVKDSDLPWIQMMPSCGLYVRPQKDDFVTVMFQGGSIYEGFYVGHTVNMKSHSENADGGIFGNKLNDEFFFNFHNSFMRGKYDGSEFELNVNKNTKIKIDGEGNIDIENKGNTIINTTKDTKINCENCEITTKGDAKINCENCEVCAKTKALIDGAGSTIEVSAAGTTINGGNLTIGNNAVPPTGLCLLATCAFTGALHTTNVMPAV